MKEIWVKTMNNNKNHKSIEEKVKSKNKRLKAVKNLKISLKVAQLVAPYVVATGITVGVLKLTGDGLPFYRDNIERCATITKTFDTLGNESIEKQFGSTKSSTNLIRHYTELEKEDNGLYTRKIETYEMNEKDSDEIEKIMKADIDYDILNEILGEPSSVSYETKNDLTSKELEAKDYLQAVVYSKDHDNVLVEKESKQKNTINTIGELVMCLLECVVITIFGKKGRDNFKNQIADIKYEYKPIDKESLEKEPNKKLVK